MTRNLDRLLRDYVAPPPGFSHIDFAHPPGAAALLPPTSLSWRVMKNPVALIVGGVAAVILELAEPRVRTGVWDHTSFRRDPVMRMRRTGYAAWTTIYAPADAARAMIAAVARAHERVEGRTPAGAPYRANDPELLNWVHATAAFGFVEAYNRYVRPLAPGEIDRFLAEGGDIATLYGASATPRSLAEQATYFSAMAPMLEASPVISEFFSIMRTAPLLPFSALQRLLVRAAVSLTPQWAREALGLGAGFGLRRGEALLVRALGAASEHFVIEEAPPAQACLRLGLPANFLYR